MSDETALVRWQGELAAQLQNAACLPQDLRKRPADIHIVLMVGSELGLGVAQSLRLVSIVKGKVFLAAELVRGRVLSSPACEYLRITRSDDQVCTILTKRRGDEPIEMSYTIEMAKRAGLVRADSGWTKHPEAMLLARCSARICRAVYPDVTAGVYVHEEKAEIVGEAPRAGFTRAPSPPLPPNEPCEPPKPDPKDPFDPSAPLIVRDIASAMAEAKDAKELCLIAEQRVPEVPDGLEAYIEGLRDLYRACLKAFERGQGVPSEQS